MARAEREPPSTANIPVVTTGTAAGLGSEGPVGVHWHDPRGTGTVRHWHDPRSARQLGSDYAPGLVDDDEDEALAVAIALSLSEQEQQQHQF